MPIVHIRSYIQCSPQLTIATRTTRILIIAQQLVIRPWLGLSKSDESCLIFAVRLLTNIKARLYCMKQSDKNASIFNLSLIKFLWIVISPSRLKTTFIAILLINSMSLRMPVIKSYRHSNKQYVAMNVGLESCVQVSVNYSLQYHKKFYISSCTISLMKRSPFE